MIARITADHHFGSDNESLFAISGVILDALRTDPAGVTQISLHVPQSPFMLPEGEDLRTQLMASTIQVIGKAGYVKATMSRIARRASCSPGAIYKLFPSKEELVVVTYSEALKSRWIPLDQFTTFLDEGVLAQFLHDVTSVENTNQRNFILEFGMAATNVEALAPAILAHANEMYELLPHLQLATEGEQRLLESMIRLFNHLTMGATMLAVASNAFQCSNFSQFAEPFRLAILARVGETWRNLSRHLLAYDSPRPEERDAIFRASPPTLPAA